MDLKEGEKRILFWVVIITLILVVLGVLMYFSGYVPEPPTISGNAITGNSVNVGYKQISLFDLREGINLSRGWNYYYVWNDEDYDLFPTLKQYNHTIRYIWEWNPSSHRGKYIYNYRKLNNQSILYKGNYYAFYSNIDGLVLKVNACPEGKVWNNVIKKCVKKDFELYYFSADYCNAFIVHLDDAYDIFRATDFKIDADTPKCDIQYMKNGNWVTIKDGAEKGDSISFKDISFYIYDIYYYNKTLILLSENPNVFDKHLMCINKFRVVSNDEFSKGILLNIKLFDVGYNLIIYDKHASYFLVKPLYSDNDRIKLSVKEYRDNQLVSSYSLREGDKYLYNSSKDLFYIIDVLDINYSSKEGLPSYVLLNITLLISNNNGGGSSGGGGLSSKGVTYQGVLEMLNSCELRTSLNADSTCNDICGNKKCILSQVRIDSFQREFNREDLNISVSNDLDSVNLMISCDENGFERAKDLMGSSTKILDTDLYCLCCSPPN